MTTSELNSTTAYYRDIIGTANALRVGQESKAINLAVRCIEDSETPGSSSEVVISSSSNPPSSSLASSSVPVSSSTAALVPPDRNCAYAPVTPATSPATGTLTCPNNEVYKTVTIGSAIWMAQNLNYGTRVNGFESTGNQSNDGAIEKYCYGDDVANCTTDGGLYQWAEAMGFNFACNSVWLSDPSCNETIAAKNHQGICPTGWHISTSNDWTAILTTLGGDSSTAGAKMKQNDGNSSGFSALPAEVRFYISSYMYRSLADYFWEASEFDSLTVKTHYLRTASASLDYYPYEKLYGSSVRCVKNP